MARSHRIIALWESIQLSKVIVLREPLAWKDLVNYSLSRNNTYDSVIES